MSVINGSNSLDRDSDRESLGSSSSNTNSLGNNFPTICIVLHLFTLQIESCQIAVWISCDAEQLIWEV